MDTTNKPKFDTMNMSKKSRYLYETMWGSPEFDFPIEKTNGSSKNSYSFTNASTTNEAACSDRLIELFGITDKELFKEKFHQSCGGSGNEITRISTLHSSALCALLFFYNVTDRHPLKLNVNGRDCVFIHSRFEFKNPVIKNPSNMDVTLVGRYADSDKPVVLFLESKFSEYMERTDKKLDISGAYKDHKFSKAVYDETPKKLGLNVSETKTVKSKDGKTEKEIFTLSSPEACYLEGIKQMISHFIGVNNFIEKGPVTNDDVITSVRGNADIYLGAIFFDKGISNFEIRKGVTCYKSYRTKYEKLADILNAQPSSVTVIKELFSYTIFENADFIKEDKIKKFYFELGK